MTSVAQGHPEGEGLASGTGQPRLDSRRWQHVKRGKGYARLERPALVQDSSGLGLREGDRVAVYIGDDGQPYVRAWGEFHDGRFVADGA